MAKNKKCSKTKSVFNLGLTASIIGLIIFAVALLIFYTINPSTNGQVLLNQILGYGTGLSASLIVFFWIRSLVKKVK